MAAEPSADYRYTSADAPWGEQIYRALERILEARRLSGGRLIDLGCGNGAFAARLAARGFEVIGVDESPSGIQLAREVYPEVEFVEASVYDDLESKLGGFDVVTSVEVIEHLYDPRRFLHTFRGLLRSGGVGLITTPYHGYWKNLTLALSGRMDDHFTALWDGGHIKFFSLTTLGQLLREVGMCDIRFHRIGRIPPLAKSMIAEFST